ncbi:AraC family transcriptional regulator [Dyella mobilis]|uniref:AraC family transcriptional regulator n=1 Tax=Dyella mobilis TaxID=1849582 RepID=A0ABS2KBJ3_9GAMM|nr:AraC family transcriptional regulator [Dyella mobilis]MBM7128550.1 AraC family transcriptional regulator [Dyella mobilis]GLQ99547.1 AraC family transcriptional regulator [Dyella mobilis]
MYAEPSSSAAGMPRSQPVQPALESLLNQSMLRVDVIAEQQHCGEWFMDEPRYDCGLFHLVGAGECLIESAALSETLHLQAGDLVVLPHGDPHRLCARSSLAQIPTSLICGELHFSSHGSHPLSRALPACFVVRAEHATAVFRHLSTMMVDVANSELPGRQVLLNKLADTLFTLAVCDYANRHADHQGLFAALADGRICKVLQAVHEEPGRAWTMQSMATLACMSRSTFAERFAQLMKVPPMQYVTQWRVSVAERMLRDRRLSVALIAEQLGYSSEAAFRRLFKRISGVSPGRIRQGLAQQTLN